MAAKYFVDNLLYENQAHELDDLSRSGRYLAMKNRGYPLPVRTGKRNRWPESAVRKWVAEHQATALASPPAAAIATAMRKRTAEKVDA